MSMQVVSLLLLEELGELRVASCESLLGVLLLDEFGLREISPRPDLALLAALLLLDVVEVGVAEEREHAQHHQEVALALVVQHVRLVPSGEHALVLMRERRLVTRLKTAVYSITKYAYYLKVAYAA